MAAKCQYAMGGVSPLPPLLRQCWARSGMGLEEAP